MDTPSRFYSCGFIFAGGEGAILIPNPHVLLTDTAGLLPLSIQTLRGAFHRRSDPFVGADKPAEQKQNVDSDPDDDAEIQYEKERAEIWHGMVGFDVTLTGCAVR